MHIWFITFALSQHQRQHCSCTCTHRVWKHLRGNRSSRHGIVCYRPEWYGQTTNKVLVLFIVYALHTCSGECWFVYVCASAQRIPFLDLSQMEANWKRDEINTLKNNNEKRAKKKKTGSAQAACARTVIVSSHFWKSALVSFHSIRDLFGIAFLFHLFLLFSCMFSVLISGYVFPRRFFFFALVLFCVTYKNVRCLWTKFAYHVPELFFCIAFDSFFF